MFDKDGEGTISAEEIREVLCFGDQNTLTIEAVDAIIKQVDENGDGEIQFEEFVTMMTALEQAQWKWSWVFSDAKLKYELV